MEVSPLYASLPEASIELYFSLKFSLGFVAIELFLWRCTELQPEVSPVLDLVEAIAGRSLPRTLAFQRSPQKCAPREFPLGFVAVEVSLWRCTELLPKVSPVFVRAEAIVGEVSPTYTSLPEVSRDMRFPLEFPLGFVAIEVSIWRCTELLPEVSPVSICAEVIVGKVFPSCTSLPEVSMETRSPLELSLGFVVIEVSIWRCTELLPEVSPVFVCAESIVGEVSPPYASLPEISLNMRFLLESFFGFVAVEVSL